MEKESNVAGAPPEEAPVRRDERQAHILAGSDAAATEDERHEIDNEEQGGKWTFNRNEKTSRETVRNEESDG